MSANASGAMGKVGGVAKGLFSVKGLVLVIFVIAMYQNPSGLAALFTTLLDVLQGFASALMTFISEVSA